MESKACGNTDSKMEHKTILYRGSLKSCNYRCSYCPFSKHQMSEKELEKDKEQWLRFVESLKKRANLLHIGAVMVVPYGEAMIHPWYWEGLASLSTLPEMEAVGVQTNLSFPVERSFQLFLNAGGNIQKIKFWATFHPEMISVEKFAETVRKVEERGAQISVGTVGVPENLEVIRQLKMSLPKECYLWINKMDGLKRSYTEEEQNTFLEIDPYFIRELAFFRGDEKNCEGRLFVEADGRMRTCNIAPFLKQNWYESWDDFPAPACSRKRCSCYLAYGGRDDYMNRVLFGKYPLFRVPRHPRAVFFDIDGTLIPDGDTSVPELTVRELKALVSDSNTSLFFATSLPYEIAIKKCTGICHLFSGGVFSAGAHQLLYGTKEHFIYINIEEKLEREVLHILEELKHKFRFRIHVYYNVEGIYKITLSRSAHMLWKPQETDDIFFKLPESFRKEVRYFTEENCIEIVSKEVSKASGVEAICQWLGISPEEATAAGNSHEDIAMMRLCEMESKYET